MPYNIEVNDKIIRGQKIMNKLSRLFIGHQLLNSSITPSEQHDGGHSFHRKVSKKEKDEFSRSLQQIIN